MQHGNVLGFWKSRQYAGFLEVVGHHRSDDLFCNTLKCRSNSSSNNNNNNGNNNNDNNNDNDDDDSNNNNDNNKTCIQDAFSSVLVQQ